MPDNPVLLHPKPELKIKLKSGIIEITHCKTYVGAIPLSLASIHTLFDSIDYQLILQGMSLHIEPRDLQTPLGFELLMQVIMVNMVHCIFPRSQKTTPLRLNLQLQSIESEINYIRNTEFINKLNHLYIAKGIFKGKGMLIALPGPSLDLDFIRKHKDTFILLAAGRAAGKLISNNIIPDFIYMQDVNAYAWDINFASLAEQQINSVLIANPLGKIYKYHKNFSRLLKAWNLYPFELDRFPKLEEIPPSTVSGAFSIARLLDCDPIIFIGNDCGENHLPKAQAKQAIAETNLKHGTEDQYLVFAPTKRMLKLYLRYADEFSVLTRNDYIAGAQWLKMRAYQHVKQSGSAIFDHSLTRLCQFNSPIKCVKDLELSNFNKTSKDVITKYKTEYDPTKSLTHKKKTYNFLYKQLQKGNLPSTALRRPFSCIFEGTEMAEFDSKEPGMNDLRIALKNIELILHHIDKAIKQYNTLS